MELDSITSLEGNFKLANRATELYPKSNGIAGKAQYFLYAVELAKREENQTYWRDIALALKLELEALCRKNS